MPDEIPNFPLDTESGDTVTAPHAYEITPGLVVHQLPVDMEPNNPRRWRIAHQPSGQAIADGMTRQDALGGAEAINAFTDWTQTAETLKATVNQRELFDRLFRANCDYPRADAMSGDVSSNGTYTDLDLQQAAVEYEGLNALQILNEMAHTVPWMGLDTEDFNEAHNRIAELVDAA